MDFTLIFFLVKMVGSQNDKNPSEGEKSSSKCRKRKQLKMSTIDDKLA